MCEKNEENPSKDRGVRERYIDDLLTWDTTLWEDTLYTVRTWMLDVASSGEYYSIYHKQ